MVLQNKHKAKASRRYNAAKNQDSTPEKRVGRRGHPSSSLPPSSLPRLDHPDDDESGSGEDQEGEDRGSEEEEEPQDPNFPSLKAASVSSPPDHSRPRPKWAPLQAPTEGRYARRQLTESKAAALDRIEAQKDPRLDKQEEGEEEAEPEVDLSGILAKVAALDVDAPSQAGVASHLASQVRENETAEEIEKDIDHSLDWLHQKEVERQKLKGRGGWSEEYDGKKDKRALASGVRGERLDLDVDSKGNKIDWEEMKRQKEKAEAVRALKARFQGRALGERERKQATRTRKVPVLDIGHHDVGKDKSKGDQKDPPSLLPGSKTESAVGTSNDSLTASSTSVTSKVETPSTSTPSLTWSKRSDSLLSSPSSAGTGGTSASSSSYSSSAAAASASNPSRSSSFSINFNRRSSNGQRPGGISNIDSFLASINSNGQPSPPLASSSSILSSRLGVSSPSNSTRPLRSGSNSSSSNPPSEIKPEAVPNPKSPPPVLQRTSSSNSSSAASSIKSSSRFNDDRRPPSTRETGAETETTTTTTTTGQTNFYFEEKSGRYSPSFKHARDPNSNADKGGGKDISMLESFLDEMLG
ncbi:hypothetical protein IE53DRAFT_408304 [Violaceomyces palustris]|uniref:Uncharacterized protein n=1 Tax=Violaceomyces palustris TaxID=1673888 RepID=A0ACD0P7G7_9BASI|nr:hypothetical protein IE53DRAFT_408304 [Violaceomyces palustris]